MKNLRELTDSVLHEQTMKLVRVERETTTQVLHHLREVERRRLFAKVGYASLFSYAVASLGYSESAAQRRIASMRLLKTLEPEAARKIENEIREGKLSLTVLSQAQTFFKQEAQEQQSYSQARKAEVVEALIGKSTREAARELVNRSTSGAERFKEYTRPAPQGKTELHIAVDEETLETLRKIKALFSHSNPEMTWGEAIAIAAKEGWRQLDPLRSRRRNPGAGSAHAKGDSENKNQAEATTQAPAEAFTHEPTQSGSNSPIPGAVVDSADNPMQTRIKTNAGAAGGSTQKPSTTPVHVSSGAKKSSLSNQNHRRYKRVHIPAELERQVRERDAEGCTFCSPITGRVCGSRFLTQVEHVVPVALGGDTSLENCTLHCAVHNQLKAIEAFGPLMEAYIEDIR